MKRTLWMALTLALMVTTAAQALPLYVEVVSGRTYVCQYWNGSGNAVNPGWSIFTITRSISDPVLRQGSETYQATTPTGQDNRKFTFAKPQNLPGGCFNPDTGWYEPCTRWEYTQNPSGPQCTNTVVSEYGDKIEFKSCSDGHRRTCYGL